MNEHKGNKNTSITSYFHAQSFLVEGLLRHQRMQGGLECKTKNDAHLESTPH